MDYSLDISEELDSKFAKLAKKNKKQLKIIDKKIRQILKDPYHFQNLRGDMQGAYRVHIDKSFVLTYEIDEKKKTIRVNPKKKALVNTIIHEELHRQFPNKPEKWIYKKADQKEKKMSIRQQIRLLLKYKK